MMISKLFGLDPDMEGMVRIFAVVYAIALIVSVASVL